MQNTTIKTSAGRLTWHIAMGRRPLCCSSGGAPEFRRVSRLSIVMIELDQSATGKTVDLPNRSPTCPKWTSICSRRAAAPVTCQFYREFPVVEQGSTRHWGQMLLPLDNSHGAIISRSSASASLRPYSRDIRFPRFARTQASGSFRLDGTIRVQQRNLRDRAAFVSAAN